MGSQTQGVLDLRRAEAVSNPRRKRNGHGCDCFSVWIQHRIANVDHSVNLIAGQLLVAALSNLVQVAVKADGDRVSGAETPGSQCTGATFVALKRENDVPRSRVEKINVRSQADRKAHVSRRIRLRNDNHFGIIEHSEMA